MVVPLVLAASVAIAACGSSSHKTAAVKSPTQLVSATFAASDAVNSGRVSLGLVLKLDGIAQLGGKPVTIDLSGPFQRGSDGVSTDLEATVSAAGASAKIGVVKVGKTVYLGLDGTFYDVSPRGSATIPLHATGPSGSSGLLHGLGINLASWLTDPHDAGTKLVDNVLTRHLTAQSNVANVLNDLSKLIGKSGSASSSTSTGVLELVQSAITTATVDVYTGVSDNIVREFDLNIAFSVPGIASGALGGLTGGSLKLAVTLTDLNQPQTIAAPTGAQPSSKLLNGIFALESKFGALASLVSSLTGTGGKGQPFGGLFAGSTSATTSTSTSASASG